MRFFFFFDQEKERELDAKNIYSNRLVKPALRKDGESSTKRKRKSLLRKKTDKERWFMRDFLLNMTIIT